MPTMATNAMAAAAAATGGQRTVLITGVSRGLGRALALEMAKRGHSVLGCGRSQDKLDSLLSHLNDSSSSSSSSSSSVSPHLLFNVDVKSNSSVEELAKGLVEKKRIPDIIENGQIEEAQMLWDECVHSSIGPNIQLLSYLMVNYARQGQYDQISGILTQIRNRNFSWLPLAYSLAISCFGVVGQLHMMESTLSEMVSMGFKVDSRTANAYVIYYSAFGSLEEMEAAYGRVKKTRILLEEGGIRAMSYAYLREKKFYKLGEFLTDVGLGRRTVGNLMWNLLLLSYAVNFKMKSLQREFLAMLEAGFRPDITTFNLRALAFSKMNLFWDLHVSLDHMRHENVIPDLVTYGCVVDAYLEKRLGKNLDFALNKMTNLDECPSITTEPFVLEVMGKGEFHLSAEAFMEFNKQKKWTYRKLIGTINKNNTIWDVPAEEFDNVIDTNVKGVANVLRHFIPLMIERKHGIVVNMSSGWGRSAAAQVAPYCASKWAVEGLSRSVAKEVSGGLAVVALSPGVVHTEMLESCFGSSANVYPPPDQWAPRAATLILNLTAADNGASLTV